MLLYDAKATELGHAMAFTSLLVDEQKNIIEIVMQDYLTYLFL